MVLSASILGLSVFADGNLLRPRAEASSDRRNAAANSEKTIVPVTEEYVRRIGRTCTFDGVTWLSQSGSAVEFEVSGSSVALEIAGDESVRNKPDLRPRFAVLVDGKVVLDDTLGESTRIVEMPIKASTNRAIVKLMLLSEANMGAVGIRSIAATPAPPAAPAPTAPDAAPAPDAPAPGAAPAPVAPTAAKSLSIEFIGDSITCAYGVEASSADDPFKTTQQNFMKSYAHIAAQALDADYSAVCYSGYGIVSGWSGDGRRNGRMLLPPVYGLVSENSGRPWDFSAHSYDVVVVNLGTNDFTYTGTDGARMKEFAIGYADFLDQVREANPASYIVCTLGTMYGSEELYPVLEQAVHDYAARTGDERVACYLSDPIDIEADDCGTTEHPNATTQQKIADALAEVIREVLG